MHESAACYFPYNTDTRPVSSLTPVEEFLWMVEVQAGALGSFVVGQLGLVFIADAILWQKTIITIIFYQGRMRSFATSTWAIRDKNSPYDAICTVISLKKEKKKSDWDYIEINALAL